jgi:L-threonylcarbamoyladenylate synthase
VISCQMKVVRVPVVACEPYLCSMAEIGRDVERAAQLLREGKLIGIPTETVYGLAANALDENSVLRVFETKERPFFDPLIIHLASLDSVKKYADIHDDRLLKLAEAFWPGPLTLLLPKKEMIPNIVTSGLPEVAARVPNHTLTLELLSKVDFPIAAPSANPFGYISPTEPQHVQRQLGDRIDYILDGGNCRIGIESTIAGIEDGQVCIFRLGGLAVEAIEKKIGRVQLRINQSGDPTAPGQLKHHYAPRKPLFVGDVDELLALNQNKKVAVICFGTGDYKRPGIRVYNLSKGADLHEAALNLFKFLREADESDADVVICSSVPDNGIGKAINDRLKRAAA